MNTQNTTTPPGTSKRQSRISPEDFKVIDNTLSTLNVQSAAGLVGFADDVCGERKSEFFANLAAYFAGIQTLSAPARAAAALGLQEAAKILYLVEVYESIISEAGEFFSEVEKAHMDKLRKESTARP